MSVVVAMRVVSGSLLRRRCRSGRMGMRMNLHNFLRRRMWMGVGVRMVVRVIVPGFVGVRNGVVVVVSTHAVFDAKLAKLAAIARHARLRHAAFQVVDTRFQQLENLALKTKVSGRGEANCRVLDLQVGNLLGDALDQRAIKKVIRQHHHLRHAQQALPLHGFFQPWPGDAGKGQVHQFVVGFFHQPARHLGHLAVGLAIRGPAPKDHHTGGGGVGHVEQLHGAFQAPLDDGQDGVTRRQMRRIGKLDLRKLQPRTVDGLRNVHLHVSGSIEN